MKKTYKISSLFIVLLLALTQFMLQSCYQLRIAAQSVSGNEITKDTTIVAWFWGINQKTIPYDSLCSHNPLASVTIKHNLGYSIINVVSLGIIAPIHVHYECANDAPQVIRPNRRGSNN